VAPDALSTALRAAVDDSFNMITVDNDQSTNDTVVCLANGAAGNERIHPDSASYAPFAAALKTACVALAREIAGDGEGATRRIEVTVRGARMLKDARRGARQIAGSSLVKSAAAGAWPNFGRILAALGATTARFDPKAVELSVCGVPVHRGGPLPFDEGEMRRLLSGKEIVVDIDLKKGPFSATAWGCDLTEEYVRINLEE